MRHRLGGILNNTKQYYKNYGNKIISLIAFTSGATWMAQKCYTTTRALNEAVDVSIVEIYEPPTSTTSEITISQQPLILNWIAPNYDDAIDTIQRVWYFFKFLYARRLMRLAQCDNEALRRRAIDNLAEIRLEGWQYSLLAHMCDARTSVALARTTNCTPSLFLPPPRRYGNYNKQLLVHSIKEYMNVLYNLHQPGHVCLHRTATRLFLEPHDESRIVDQDHSFEDLLGRGADTLMPLCLKTIRHHSILPQYSNDIVHFHGLDLLMEIYHRYNQDHDMCIELCNIIANISLTDEFLEMLYKAGWISVLAKWINDEDLRLSGPASQALRNLDKDCNATSRLSTKAYNLYPTHRSCELIKVDVIFIHGLLGHVFHTWRNGKIMEEAINLTGKPPTPSIGAKESIGLDPNALQRMHESSDPAAREFASEMEEEMETEWEALGDDYEFVYYDVPTNSSDTHDTHQNSYTFNKAEKTKMPFKSTQCWAQDWLPADCKSVRVFGTNYNTSLFEWANVCPETSLSIPLDERATVLLKTLENAGIGRHPIVWVTHSMGGLVLKAALAQALKSHNPQLNDICVNSRMIVFYATPHFGSKMANFNATTEYLILPTMDVQELREGSPNLLRIHADFLKVLEVIPMKIISFIETKATLVTSLKINFRLVDFESAKLDIGEWYEVPQSHLGICKPANKESFLYQKVLHEIRRIIEEEDRRNYQFW